MKFNGKSKDKLSIFVYLCYRNLMFSAKEERRKLFVKGGEIIFQIFFIGKGFATVDQGIEIELVAF